MLMDVQPDVISAVLTTQLVVNCSITNNHVAELDVIKYLTLSIYNESIKSFEDLLTLEANTFNLQKIRQFKHSQIKSGNLFITLTLQDPTQFDAKVYRCNVTGDAYNATTISFVSNKKVKYETISTSLLEQVRRLKKDIESDQSPCKKEELTVHQKQKSKLDFFGSSEVIKELIEPLALKCTYKVMNHDQNKNSTVQSLYIFHETNEIIATINKGETVATNQGINSKNVKAELSNNESRDSYIQVTWSHLKLSESGKYFCGASVQYSESKNENFNKMLTITITRPTFDDLVKVIQKILTKSEEDKELILGNIQSFKDDLNANKQHIESVTEDLNDTKENMKNYKEEMKIIVVNLSTTTTDINKEADEGNTEDKDKTYSVKRISPKSCRDVNSTYDRVVVTLASGLKVMCDTKADGGGWIVIQRRVNGKVHFFRDWSDYRNGFGDYKIGEFYLGNENIFMLTSCGQYVLRIDLKYNNQSYYAQYTDFQISSESENYKLDIKSYSGNARDSLSCHKGSPFSTVDRDNDGSSANSAVAYLGAWWYTGGCHYSNINGKGELLTMQRD
ncbi:BpFREP20.3 [Biomphalaria pfeifferi]|uniref:BpFREP20.3 n=1 Tax=Biomphalaria pfeifferi TaxID=112525 RepID=A0AAD8BVD4_BIOPF|nr:BpFREP20.3 [Biomphalaria pfeifferi]